MHVLDAARDLDRAGERQPHVAERRRHGVAIDDDQAALGVDDHARAVVAALGDARDRIRHVEVDQHERRREPIDDRIGRLREAGRRRLRRLRVAVVRPRRARPRAELRRRACTTRAGIPAPIHAHHAPLRRVRIVDREEAHRRALAVLAAPRRPARNRRASAISLAADFGDHGAARHAGRAEHVTGIGDVHAADRHVDVARLLPRQVVHDARRRTRGS